MRHAVKNEVHVCNAPNGHVLSVDCWCEPVAIQWIVNKHGVRVLVVEHEDDTLKHHIVVTGERERDKAQPYAQNEPGAPWITRVLDLTAKKEP